jgi:hypothetical protein
MAKNEKSPEKARPLHDILVIALTLGAVALFGNIIHH